MISYSFSQRSYSFRVVRDFFVLNVCIFNRRWGLRSDCSKGAQYNEEAAVDSYVGVWESRLQMRLRY